MLSAIPFDLDQSRILSSGNNLMYLQKKSDLSLPVHSDLDRKCLLLVRSILPKDPSGNQTKKIIMDL